MNTVLRKILHEYTDFVQIMLIVSRGTLFGDGLKDCRDFGGLGRGTNLTRDILICFHYSCDVPGRRIEIAMEKTVWGLSGLRKSTNYTIL